VTDPRPVPLPDEISGFFWEGAREKRLLVQRCQACAKLQYPPDVVCIHCQSVDLVPEEVSGRGTLWSFTRVERVFHAGFAEAVPYVVGLVELEEQADVRLLTNIVDAEPAELRVGLALEVTFEDRGEVVLPQFRPAAGP